MVVPDDIPATIATLDEPEIELLLLANHVEGINGLLFVSGGGWTDINRTIQPGQAPPPSHFGIGVGVRVPWNETNRVHHLEVFLEDRDATTRLANVNAQFNVGRPPTLPPGEDQHTVLALNVDLVFPKAGGYRVVARLGENRRSRTWSFRIHDIMSIPAPGGMPSTK